MASLPFQPQRRPSTRSEDITSPEPPQETSRPSSPQIAAADTDTDDTKPTESTYTPNEPTAPPHPTDDEVRTCWICQQDDIEDISPDTIWRRPCPCTLTAHDECLLEWITNEEAPAKGEIAYNHIIKCPQCQAEIQIDRPRDLLVAVVDRIQRIAKKLVAPTAISAIAGCIYSGMLVYGMNTMHIVFGLQDARNIIGGLQRNGSLQGRLSRFFSDSARWSFAFDPFFPDAGSPTSLLVYLGLPFIAPVLILSRSKIADRAFSLVLPLYFLEHSHRVNMLNWPPTPGLAFATLPYLRQAYNEAFRKLIRPYEEAWEAKVQRQTREENQGLLEIQFNEEVVGPDGIVIPDPEVPPQDGANVAAPAAGAGPEADLDNWGIRREFSTASILSSSMGALFFPTIASLVGEILKISLPSKWINGSVGLRFAGRYSGPGGFLTRKWGRTIVGGCLFVVLKDVVTLYCKWKRARDFGKRRILDFVKN